MSEIKGICNIDKITLNMRDLSNNIIEIIDLHFHDRSGKSYDEFKNHMRNRIPAMNRMLTAYLKMIESDIEWLNINVSKYFPDEDEKIKLENKISNVLEGPWKK